MTLTPLLLGGVENPGVVGQVIQVVAAEEDEQLAGRVIDNRGQCSWRRLGIERLGRQFQLDLAAVQQFEVIGGDALSQPCFHRRDQGSCGIEMSDRVVNLAAMIFIHRTVGSCAGRQIRCQLPQSRRGRPQKRQGLGLGGLCLLLGRSTVEVDEPQLGQSVFDLATNVAIAVVVVLQRVSFTQLPNDGLPFAGNANVRVRDSVVGFLILAAERDAGAVGGQALGAPEGT